MAGTSLGSHVGSNAGSTLGTRAGSLARPPGAPAGAPSSGAGFGVAATALRDGFLRVASLQDPFPFVDVLTTGEPTVPLADSGWESVTIPLHVDAPVWRSGRPLTFSASFTMDRLTVPDQDVQDEWDVLFGIYRPDNGAVPAPVRVYGPVDADGRRWVIRDIQIDDAATKRRSNRLVRISGTIVFGQFFVAGVAEYANPDKVKNLALQDRPRFAVAGADGDTLKDIAKNRLGNGRRYRDIQAMYDDLDDQRRPSWVRKPTETIPKGTQVRLPNG
jgi:hypothetical protein